MNDIKDMDTLKDWSQYIYGQAMISEAVLVDPSSYTKVVNKIISGELVKDFLFKKLFIFSIVSSYIILQAIFCSNVIC